MPPAIAALARHLTLYKPVLDAGLEAMGRLHAEGAISSHALLRIRHDARVVDRVLSGYWGHESVGLAYQACANLTPLVEHGLRKAGTQHLLRADGVLDAWNHWRAPFTAYGMTAIHANTGAPCWPRGTSC
jgi:hypothetical protein